VALQKIFDGSLYLRFDFMGPPGSVYDLEPREIRLRQFQVPAPDALEESQTVSLEPAWPARPRTRMVRLAGMRPRQRGSRVQVKDHRQVRLEAPANRTVEGSDEVSSEPPPVALIGKTRGVESVAEHQFAARESGPNNLLNVLGPRRVHEPELCERGDAEFFSLDEQPADCFPELRPSGLACPLHAIALPPQAPRQFPQVGAFSRAVNAVECDEKTAHEAVQLVAPGSAQFIRCRTVEQPASGFPLVPRLNRGITPWVPIDFIGTTRGGDDRSRARHARERPALIPLCGTKGGHPPASSP
jgi:hypothetical protein